MSRYVVIWCLLIALVTFTKPTFTYAQPTNQFLYSYAFQTNEGNVVIRVIDPEVPTNALDLYQFPLPSDATGLVQAISSPNGEWVALVFGNYQISSITLLNMLTGQLINLAEIVPPDYEISESPQQDIAWSPDSNYLAYNALQGDINSGSDTMLYNIQTGITTNLTNDTTNQYHLAWSGNGAVLVIFQEELSLAGTQLHTFGVYDVSNENLTHTLLIDERRGGPYSYSALCDLRVSPNGQYITFSKSCDSTVYEDIKELYIADITQNSVVELTSFTENLTPPDTDSPFNPRYAMYTTLWYDADTLFIGAVYPNSEVRTQLDSQTLVYHPSTNQIIPVNNGITQEWALNPVSSQVAFRYIEDENTSINFTNYTNGTFTTLYEVPTNGSQLTWDQNGNYLGFQVNSSTVGFIDATNGQFAQHAIVDNGNILPETMMPAGWIITSGDGF